MSSVAHGIEAETPRPPDVTGADQGQRPAARSGRLAERSRWSYGLLAVAHVSALVATSGYLAVRWFETLYHLREDGPAETVIVLSFVVWLLALGFVGWSWSRRLPAVLPVAAVLVSTATLAAGATLFELSFKPEPVVQIEGEPLFATVAPAARLTEDAGAPTDFDHQWQQAAYPGQTVIWNGLAVRLTAFEWADQLPGLPELEDGRYLVFIVELTGREPYGDGWPGERTALEVSVDKVRIVPRDGWEMGVPAEPQLPGWRDDGGTWQPYGYEDLRPQLPIPATGETVSRRFAVAVPRLDPLLGRYDSLFVVVHPDVEFACYMRPPDIERRCTWLLLAWEIPRS